MIPWLDLEKFEIDPIIVKIVAEMPSCFDHKSISELLDEMEPVKELPLNVRVFGAKDWKKFKEQA